MSINKSSRKVIFKTRPFKRSYAALRRFNSSAEVIKPMALMYVRFPLPLWNAKDLLFKHGIDMRHEIVQLTALYEWLLSGSGSPT